MIDLFRFVSAAAADREAQRWYDSVDRSEKVGAKHHIVPRMVLKRFANAKEQLYVRDRETGRGMLRNIGDLAVRDFNTVVAKDAKLDSSLESLLSVVEGAAAAVIRTHLDAEAFTGARPLTVEDRFKLDTFVAFQSLRGMRQRRAYELAADYGMKLLNQQHLTADDIENLDIIPHPNEFIQLSAQLAELAQRALSARPLSFIRIDRPLFIIGDEPVLLLRDGPLPPVDLNGYPNVTIPGLDQTNIIQLQSGGGVGLANADAVILPVSPRVAFMYGPHGSSSVAESRVATKFQGDEAEEVAMELNVAVAERAVSWVAAHPEHPTLREMNLPSPIPILQVIDGGSPIARRTNAQTRRRPIRRVRPGDVHDVPGAELG
ncbi:DUF4238 domain-containing protein [Agromyces soli]